MRLFVPRNQMQQRIPQRRIKTWNTQTEFFVGSITVYHFSSTGTILIIKDTSFVVTPTTSKQKDVGTGTVHLVPKVSAAWAVNIICTSVSNPDPGGLLDPDPYSESGSTVNIKLSKKNDLLPVHNYSNISFNRLLLMRKSYNYEIMIRGLLDPYWDFWLDLELGSMNTVPKHCIGQIPVLILIPVSHFWDFLAWTEERFTVPYRLPVLKAHYSYAQQISPAVKNAGFEAGSWIRIEKIYGSGSIFQIHTIENRGKRLDCHTKFTILNLNSEHSCDIIYIFKFSVVDPDPHGSGTFAWIRN